MGECSVMRQTRQGDKVWGVETRGEGHRGHSDMKDARG